MEPITTSCILGLVEGITEFLPVSSTGHLVIASSLLGITGEKAATFEVVIQVGAMLAVIALYWHKLLVPRGDSRLSGTRGIGLLLLTTIPGAALGLLLHSRIKMLFTPASVAAALLAGSVFMLLAEGCIGRRPRREARGADDITPFQALGVGLFQCLALWPGFSRSASTIADGMLLSPPGSKGQVLFNLHRCRRSHHRRGGRLRPSQVAFPVQRRRHPRHPGRVARCLRIRHRGHQDIHPPHGELHTEGICLLPRGAGPARVLASRPVAEPHDPGQRTS